MLTRDKNAAAESLENGLHKLKLNPAGSCLSYFSVLFLLCVCVCCFYVFYGPCCLIQMNK